jgi:glycosyltransferase involved in cell wall biosynthesis
MNVLHIIAPGTIAGAEKSVLASVKALMDAGQETRLAVIGETRDPAHGREFISLAKERGIDSIELTARGRIDLALINRLHTVVTRGAYDVVHSHSYKSLAHLSAFRSRIPVLVATYHGATSHDLTAKLYERIQWALFQNVDCLFAVSQGAKEALEMFGASRCRIAVVPNMLGEAVPEPRLPGADGKATPDFLYLGRLSVEKGIDILIRALARLPKSFRFKLTIVGDGPERGRLEQMVRKEGLEERVFFLGFQLNINDCLASADVLVMPSRREGLPMALIEAAASGKPVVASRVGGIPDIVEDGINGLLVEPESVEGLCKAIEQIGNNLYRFQVESVNRAQQIQVRYSPERWAERAMVEYERAMEMGKRQ